MVMVHARLDGEENWEEEELGKGEEEEEEAEGRKGRNNSSTRECALIRAPNQAKHPSPIDPFLRRRRWGPHGLTSGSRTPIALGGTLPVLFFIKSLCFSPLPVFALHADAGLREAEM